MLNQAVLKIFHILYPSRKNETHLPDQIFYYLLKITAWLVLLLLVAMFIFLVDLSWPTLKKFGFEFVVSNIWNPPVDQYGALAFIYGTLGTSLIALVLAAPLSIGVALFLSELAPRRLAQTVGFLVEMLAAVPSVIYGLWGIFVLAPLMQSYVQPFLISSLGPETFLGRCMGVFFTALFYPFAFIYSLFAESHVTIDSIYTHFKTTFGGPSFGVGMLTAGLILTIMICPTVTSICKEVFHSIPKSHREAGLALGATRWESLKMAVLRSSKTGIVGALIMGLGRALGETMAVTMVIGNRNDIDSSILAPAQTMASVIANEYPEAFDLQLSSLAAVGLVLFLLSLVINIFARLIVWNVERHTGGGRL